LLCRTVSRDHDQSVAGCGLDFRGAAVQALPTKSALYAEILAEECEADPAMHWLFGLEPSTETLVVLMRAIVHHFPARIGCARSGGGQRLRLMISSELDDGEFARLIYGKIADWFSSVFRHVAGAGVAAETRPRIGSEAADLFWFAHHTLPDDGAGAAARRSKPVLWQRRRPSNGRFAKLILRGIGLNENRDCFQWIAETSAGSGDNGKPAEGG